MIFSIKQVWSRFRARRVLTVGFLATICIVISAGAFEAVPVAAWPGPLTTLSPNGLQLLAWPYLITNNPTCTGSCYKDPSFSASTSSYVIGYDPSPPGGIPAPASFGPYNCGVGYGITQCYNYVIYWTDATSCQLHLVGDGSSTYHMEVTPPCTYNEMDIQEYAGKYWGASVHTYLQNLNSSAGYSNNITAMTGIWAVKNVAYVNWDQPFFNSNPQYGSSGGSGSVTCSALDFGCWMGSIWNNVANDIVSALQALVQSLAVLFVPSGTQLSTDWTTFNSTLQAHLGFLLWPFSFIGNIFTAITTPTTTCCTVGAGTIFGAHWSGINLKYVSTAIPSLWSFAQLAIQGLTILLLIFYLRHKFLEITHKG